MVCRVLVDELLGRDTDGKRSSRTRSSGVLCLPNQVRICAWRAQGDPIATLLERIDAPVLMDVIPTLHRGTHQ